MTPNGQQIVAKIEIALFANGSMGINHQLPSRYIFNGLMETAKQQILMELMAREQEPKPKVVLPNVDVSRLQM
jgi:hypothetical protein